jgi:hypothetical protein
LKSVARRFAAVAFACVLTDALARSTPVVVKSPFEKTRVGVAEDHGISTFVLGATGSGLILVSRLGLRRRRKAAIFTAKK